MVGADSTFVIAKNGYFAIAVVVQLDFLVDCGIFVLLGIQVLEQIRHRVGSIIGTEHFRSESWHVVRQVLVELRSLDQSVCLSPTSQVESTYIDTIKYVVAVLFGRLFEHFEILENLAIDRALIVESNAVLSQEVEDNRIRFSEGDMFELE